MHNPIIIKLMRYTFPVVVLLLRGLRHLALSLAGSCFQHRMCRVMEKQVTRVLASFHSKTSVYKRDAVTKDILRKWYPHQLPRRFFICNLAVRVRLRLNTWPACRINTSS